MSAFLTSHVYTFKDPAFIANNPFVRFDNVGTRRYWFENYIFEQGNPYPVSRCELQVIIDESNSQDTYFHMQPNETFGYIGASKSKLIMSISIRPSRILHPFTPQAGRLYTTRIYGYNDVDFTLQPYIPFPTV